MKLKLDFESSAWSKSLCWQELIQSICVKQIFNYLPWNLINHLNSNSFIAFKWAEYIQRIFYKSSSELIMNSDSKIVSKAFHNFGNIWTRYLYIICTCEDDIEGTFPLWSIEQSQHTLFEEFAVILGASKIFVLMLFSALLYLEVPQESYHKDIKEVNIDHVIFHSIRKTCHLS